MVMVRQSFEKGLFLCVVSGREPQGPGFAVSSVLGLVAPRSLVWSGVYLSAVR